MKKAFTKIFIAFAIICSTSVLFAQPSGGGGGLGGGGNPPDGTGGPIDSGAVILMIGIAGYAHQKLKEDKQLNQD